MSADGATLTDDLLEAARAWLAQDPDGQTRDELRALISRTEEADAAAAAELAIAQGAIAHEVVVVDLRSIGGSAMTADIDVPEYAGTGIPVTYVPARNTIMLSVALGWAEVLGAQEIHCGVNAVDYSGYPDCRDDTLKALQVAINLGMERRFVLHTPLMWRDKAATWALAARLGGTALVEAVRTDTHSCYLGDRSTLHEWGYGCGSCPACELRRRGWEQWHG